MPLRLSRNEFMKQYVFPNEPARDFEHAGIPAQFASGHPKDWSQACHVLDFSLDIPQESAGSLKTSHTAISSDGKLLAISTSVERILIYDILSRELRAVLEGAGTVRFRPKNTVDKNDATTSQSTGEHTVRPAYTLVGSISDEAYHGIKKLSQLILWDLDQNGRLMDQEETIDSVALAKRAIDAILPTLVSNHEWTTDFIGASNLHRDFAEALSKAAIVYRRRHNTVIKDAQLGGFESVSFSSDGRLLLYHASNRSTQQGMRALEELPQLVIYDLDAGVELRRLMGHTDAIMWSAISPDNKHAASVSWDGSLRMYLVSSGELVWATERSELQSWTGAFSSDSKLIAWSTHSGRVIQVHQVVDGRQISTMQEQFSDWCRCLKWHPTRSEIALCVGKDVYVWDVFGGPDGKTLQHFKLDDDNNSHRMAGVLDVGWMKGDQLLYVASSDGTKLVYNVHTNAKELFKRSIGGEARYVTGGFYGIFQDEMGQELYMSVDGDGKVRYWRTSIASSPSWWERKPIQATTEKKPFPETGKYVKIVRKSEKQAKQEGAARE
ncbi:F-box and wd40 domain [Pyrenophora seminiperda CCB06]|uniref:F-box and wd40 domain n=1 Tax=Pyrenophora seminiperda CCB06 TaxID=1302712 RepID=A0A3M7LVH5_9PLEO|nr:F-box and wd40 domain [Pyrenophora seminiperda CCB06]